MERLREEGPDGDAAAKEYLLVEVHKLKPAAL